MTRNELYSQILLKKSYLCVGLDTDLAKVPPSFLKYKDPVYEFNRQIIDATRDFCVAYKPNLAFYECLGASGWESLQRTMEYIPDEIFTIADAKRGDIGNTSGLYAKAFFETFNFDAVTVAPYMGSDSVQPFLQYKDKWVILLALTSNAGAFDFQTGKFSDPDEFLFERVLRVSQTWGDAGNMMYVVGATKAVLLQEVRKLVPDHFLLVPGVGAQGGSLEEVTSYGLNSRCGLLVNSSRNILYASQGDDFAIKAAAEAKRMQQEMSGYLC